MEIIRSNNKFVPGTKTFEANKIMNPNLSVDWAEILYESSISHIIVPYQSSSYI